jgi:hypothetical protein
MAKLYQSSPTVLLRVSLDLPGGEPDEVQCPVGLERDDDAFGPEEAEADDLVCEAADWRADIEEERLEREEPPRLRGDGDEAEVPLRCPGGPLLYKAGEIRLPNEQSVNAEQDERTEGVLTLVLASLDEDESPSGVTRTLTGCNRF